MKRVIPEKNEDAFRKWDRERRVLTGVFWFLVILSICIFVGYPLVYRLVYALFPTLFPIPIAPAATALEMLLKIFIIVGAGVLYAIVLIIIRWVYIKRRLGQLSKEACIFAAIVAAEDLKRGNPVRASLFMDRLLLALSDFLGQKLVALGVGSVAPKDLMHATPETIPKRAVRRAIQASEDTEDFQESLRDLAIGLRGNMDARYLAAHKFLVWLNRKTEPYQQASKSFLDKRPALRTVLLQVFPVVVPALALIVGEVHKLLGG